jgi:hypothetical protein
MFECKTNSNTLCFSIRISPISSFAIGSKKLGDDEEDKEEEVFDYFP